MESAEKYFESVPTGLGTSFLRLDLGAFGIGLEPSWVSASGGEVHESAIVGSTTTAASLPLITGFSSSAKVSYNYITGEGCALRVAKGTRLGIDV